VAGQLTWYRGEAGRWDDALAIARACRSPEPGWCALLEGFALHGAGRLTEAERSFRAGLAALPEEERDALLDPEWLLEPDVAQALRDRSGAEREALAARIWRLGSPLYQAGGNALLTAHLSRHVLARIQGDARNAYGMRWGGDMTEILVRFGPEAGWERVREPFTMTAESSIVGRFSGGAKGVVPGLEALLDPSRAPAAAFPAATFRARSIHAVPGLPRLRGMSARVTRFLRGDTLLLVAAWRVPPPQPWDSVPPRQVADGGLWVVRAGGIAPLRAEEDALPADPPASEGRPTGAFPVLAPGDAPLRAATAHGESGAVMARVPPDAQVVSLELVDAEGGRAWRHRQGLLDPTDASEAEALSPPRPGQVTLSDLLLLRPEDPDGTPPPEAPDRLEAHVHRALPTDTVDAGPVEVGWEIYGRPAGDDPVSLVLSVERGERGLLRRAAEALRIVSPVEPVEIRWEEGVAGGGRGPPDAGPSAPVFRRVTLELGGLSSGDWVLRLAPATGGGPARGRATRIVIR
jgi:hypothetical protein